MLFLFFNAPLIEGCAKLKLPVQVGGFVDDIYLIAYSKSTESNYKVLKNAHEVCLTQAKTYGAAFTPHKYELVHLTRRPKRFNLEAVVNLGEAIVKLEISIRRLGL